MAQRVDPIIASTANGQRLEISSHTHVRIMDDCNLCPAGMRPRYAEVDVTVYNDPRIPVGPTIHVCGDCLSRAVSVPTTGTHVARRIA